MPATSARKPGRLAVNNQGFCSVFGIKASIIIVGFILMVAVLSLFYLCTWTIITKHKYALLASAYLYAISTYSLLISASITCIAIVVLFVTAWIEHAKGLKLVRQVHNKIEFFFFSHEADNCLDTCRVNFNIYI